MRAIPIMVGLLALAACNSGAPPADNSAVNAAAESAPTGEAVNYVREVRALPPLQRNGVLLRAIRDAGIPCQEVTESEEVEVKDSDPTWRATCGGGGGMHLVRIAPDGVGTVVSRSGGK